MFQNPFFEAGCVVTSGLAVYGFLVRWSVCFQCKSGVSLCCSSVPEGFDRCSRLAGQLRTGVRHHRFNSSDPEPGAARFPSVAPAGGYWQ